MSDYREQDALRQAQAQRDQHKHLREVERHIKSNWPRHESTDLSAPSRGDGESTIALVGYPNLIGRMPKWLWLILVVAGAVLGTFAEPPPNATGAGWVAAAAIGGAVFAVGAVIAVQIAIVVPSLAINFVATAVYNVFKITIELTKTLVFAALVFGVIALILGALA